MNLSGRCNMQHKCALLLLSQDESLVFWEMGDSAARHAARRAGRLRNRQ